MKTALVLLSLFVLASATGRLPGRSLRQKHACPNYQGPLSLQNDVKLKITYLKGVPEETQLVAYEGILDMPIGTLYGKATVHFSSPLPSAPQPDYFRVSGFSGMIIGMIASADGCDVMLDFVVGTTCDDACIPMGVCLEIDNARIMEDIGYHTAFRKHCKSLQHSDRPRCLYASWMALGMSKSENDVMAHTSSDTAELMILLNTPYPAFLDFKPEDFTISGPEGTVIESVTAAVPGHATNVAYTVVVKHGAGAHDTEIKICLVGAGAILATGSPYQMDEGICASYMKTIKENNGVAGTLEIYKSNSPNLFCPFDDI